MYSINILMSPPKAKLDMTEAILGRYSLEYCKLWRQPESENEMKGTYKKNDIWEIYKKDYRKGDADEVFKYCLDNVRNYFFNA